MLNSLMNDPLEENLHIQHQIFLFYPCRSRGHGLDDLKEPHEASIPHESVIVSPCLILGAGGNVDLDTSLLGLCSNLRKRANVLNLKGQSVFRSFNAITLMTYFFLWL